MNIVDVIDRTIPELIDIAELLSDIDKYKAKINSTKQTLLGEDTKLATYYTVDENNIFLIKSKLVLINKLNRKIFANLLGINAIIESAYKTERYALCELLTDIIPDYIAHDVFYEEYQVYSIAKDLGLASRKVMQNKALNLKFESNRYSFSLKDYILGWIVNDMPIEPLYDFVAPFVETKEDTIKLQNACWNLYKKKYAFELGADNYQKVKYGLNTVFSSLDLKSNIFNFDNKGEENKSKSTLSLNEPFQR